MRKILSSTLLLNLFLSGCSSVDVSDVTGPHGKRALRLACKHDQDCYVQAKRHCRQSYNIENSFYDTQEKQFVMMITCEADPRAD